MVWGGHGLGFDSGASKKYPPNYQLAPAKIEIEGWRVSQMVQPCKGCGNECNEFNPNNVFIQIQDAQMKLCFMTASWIRTNQTHPSEITGANASWKISCCFFLHPMWGWKVRVGAVVGRNEALPFGWSRELAQEEGKQVLRWSQLNDGSWKRWWS